MRGKLVKISGRNLTFRVEKDNNFYDVTLPAKFVGIVDKFANHIGDWLEFDIAGGEIVFPINKENKGGVLK